MNTIGHVSLSIAAIQVIPHKNTCIEQIMQQADERLYWVKKDTRNAFNLLELDRNNQQIPSDIAWFNQKTSGIAKTN